ncbi:TRAP-type mannitol/chloroaromatic compound transport system permease small subunit [Paucimonas lemoignei]|uniref:TRAP transporter small permease protein n=1 Tax=Paucimonas lemoignei TaxID=29443 RepID=A0A4R3HRA5_PAULE|nr:TRAP transporter small permease subunit [Paucimonas lemoignei]TCS34023.1 TRAP-type mannitol/chloroaromatic compound transport system permease small subunit [Paucimonas lemoignei]
MNALLSLSRLIDAINIKIGQAVSWLLLAAVLICSGNALVRYIFHIGSNAWLEIQWYLFGAVFLLAAGYTLRRNEHVRIDVVVSRFSKRTQAWIDALGFLLFLLPITLLVLYFAIPFAVDAIRSQEMSSNAGGLILWPAKLLVPIGFFLLGLQGISELIKRIGFLMGKVDASEFERQAVKPEDEVAAIKAANKID